MSNPLSWIYGCFIKARDDETEPTLIGEDAAGQLFVRLDCYAIVPIEEYFRLRDLERKTAGASKTKTELHENDTYCSEFAEEFLKEHLKRRFEPD